MKSVLNIAAGKIEPLYIDTIQENYFLVQLDQFYNNSNSMAEIELDHDDWLKKPELNTKSYCGDDAFNFLANYRIQFDHIACYRFLEHITKTEVQGFIYLLSTALKVGGTVDIIVPNYDTLADMILNETISNKTKHSDWEKHDTLLTYELLNEPSMPHASIWTPQRIKYFFRLEERFEIESLNPDFEFDGRDCYIRVQMKRIK